MQYQDLQQFQQAPPQQDTDLIRYTLSIKDDALIMLYEVLLGVEAIIEVDTKTGIYHIRYKKIDGKKPLVNMKGFYEIKNLVLTYVNVHTLMSNIPSFKVADKMAYEFYERLAENLFLNQKEWAPEYTQFLTDKEMELIIDTFTPIVRTALYRAVEGVERRTLREPMTIHHTETIEKKEEGREQSPFKKMLGM